MSVFLMTIELFRHVISTIIFWAPTTKKSTTEIVNTILVFYTKMPAIDLYFTIVRCTKNVVIEADGTRLIMVFGHPSVPVVKYKGCM